ncbi:MAG: spore cortex-lytic enzyme [Clostridia bacterium]|nr:spore cortex-lytic enzyme [Clostridia bacterium]MBR2968214.1 spore cortex-lytic enzyme [Clostridia bacterium]
MFKRKLIVVIAVLALCIISVGAVTATAVSSADAVPVVLRQGSSGQEVRTMQQKLKNWGYYTGAVDGIFGSQTRKAVIYFQRKNGLTPDGIVGKKTLAALGMSGGGGTTSGTGGYSNSDVYLLARLIHSEARGETYTGQVAVGAVVLNRVKSSSFPNTISGVVYQRNAFTAVADGQINLEPNATAVRAAKDAMNGWDPSYGSLYYYNPAIATSKWILTRKVVVTIGNHVFAV